MTKKTLYGMGKALGMASLVLLVLGTLAFGGPLKVGMVTDAGTIDDKSFNQGTWEGVLKAQKELKIKPKYLQPGGTTEADYLKEIGNLYDAGYRFIVTPGFKFETSIYKAQNKYPKGKFVILDGAPHKGDYKHQVNSNTVAIFFAEHQAGFMAGLAAALELKKGSFGFIGGMEIPAVQKFNWGYQQGIAYANEHYGTEITMNPENFIYQGTFSDVAAGQQIAASMYDRGVKAIFAAAGGVGVGVINEAKSRNAAGKKVWVIGVDVDQYADGIYDGTHSAILTSAMKKIDQATFDIIKDDLEGKFPGGQTLVFNASNDGVGLPLENPNLGAEVQKTAADIYAKLQSGKIEVASERGELFR